MGRLYAEFLGGARGLSLLILRATAGAALMIHGWDKIKAPMSWMTAMAPPGQAPPGFLQALAAGAEFIGGACWIIGLLTPVASLFIMGTFVFATFLVHVGAGHPFVASGHAGPSAESAAMYLIISIVVMLVGPGRLSVDSMLFGRGPIIKPDPARELSA